MPVGTTEEAGMLQESEGEEECQDRGQGTVGPHPIGPVGHSKGFVFYSKCDRSSGGLQIEERGEGDADLQRSGCDMEIVR